MNAIAKDITSAALTSAEQAAAIEPLVAVEKMSRRLAKPLTTAEFLDPSLILADVDMGHLDRAAAAIKTLRKHGVTEFPNHAERDARPSMMTIGDAEEMLSHARSMAATFDSLRIKRVKA
jgi:hypothetical protein